LAYPRSYGEYVLLERLGSGGMSDVDLAKKAMNESGYERFVVIKRVKADRVADESFIRMFKDEARITSQLNHTNIAQTYDFGRVGDEYFLVLEYVPGFDVRGIINVLRDRDQRVPLRVVLFIMHEVLAGLAYAHNMIDVRGQSMNIVHRDVNPRNIMMSVRGEVKLIDFGVAKAADRLERTRTDHVKGKFRYMSPEQITGKSIDHRADLFALGLTFHELLAGYSPYVGLTHIQIMHKLVSGEVPPLPAVQELRDTTELARIHGKALHGDLNRRYRDAAEFRADILSLADMTGGLPKPSQVTKFLQHVDKDFEGLIQKKLEDFSGPIEFAVTDEDDGSVSDLRPQLDLPDDLSATLKALKSLEVATTESQSRVGLVGGMLLGTAVTVSTLVILVLSGVYYLLNYTELPLAWNVGPGAENERRIQVESDEPAKAAADVVVVGEGTREQPETAAASHKQPLVQGAAAGGEPLKTVVTSADGAATDGAATDGAATEGTSSDEEAAPNADGVGPADLAEGIAPDEVVISGTPEAKDSVSDEAPEVKVEPPKSLVFGMLQVTSAEKGRKIWIDGSITDFTTPARLEWPVGGVEITVEGYESKQVNVRESQVNNVIFR
jgi:serine/threonine protein kinase